jgi:hypothetical protein
VKLNNNKEIYMPKKLKKINSHKAKVLLARRGFKIKPSYCHEDYMLSSFSMPYDIKDKLTRIKLKWGIPASSLITILVDSVNEDTLEFK